MIPDPATPRRIVALRAENFKRLKAFSMKPDGTLCVLSGRNGHGKTSVLDSIWSALCGATAFPPRPVRNGTKRAVIELDLGDLTVTRTFTDDGNSSLTVRDADSAKLGSPQKILDRLVGKLGFDPLAFTRLSAREQAEMLRRLVGLDLGEIDQKRAGLDDERKEVNRAVKLQEAQLKGLPEPNEDTPSEPVDVATLLEELRTARKDQADNDSIRQAKRNIEQTRRTVQDRLAELERERDRVNAAITRTNERLVELASETSEVDAQIGELTDPPIAELEQRLADAQRVNQQVRDRREREAKQAEIQANREHSASLAGQIDLIDADRAKRLADAAAKLPVPGLSFDGDGVTLDGVPLEQASSAQQIRAGLAISAALNPSLRVALVRDGSLLDQDGLRAVHEWAEANQVQVFLERVADPGTGIGVIIEDGEILADRQTETAAALLF